MKTPVHFRLIQMPCCGQMLCWVNPRLPNYCPECGNRVLMMLRHTCPENILETHEDAWLSYGIEKPKSDEPDIDDNVEQFPLYSWEE